MDKINFLLKENFPFSNETGNKLQKQNELLARLTAIGGDNYILSGCVDTEGVVSDGYIVIAGELLPFIGGVLKTDLIIVEERLTETAFGTDYPDAYVNRHVELADDGDYVFSEFKQVLNNVVLAAKLESSGGTPIGVTMGWAGFIDKVPEQFMLCDGRALKIEDYPELYAVIGGNYGVVGSTEFRLPNKGGKVDVGYNSGDSDYDAIGGIGGSKEVTLTEQNIPKHDHVNSGSAFNRLSAKASDLTSEGTIGAGVDDVNADEEYRISDMTTLLWDQSKVQAFGGDGSGITSSFDIRQPYFVEGKIIKVKN